jgi:hypothetical protein
VKQGPLSRTLLSGKLDFITSKAKLTTNNDHSIRTLINSSLTPTH